MKGRIKSIGVLLSIVMFCFGVFTGCSDDDDNPTSSALKSENPSYGFFINSTAYRIVLDLGQKNDFDIALEPGEMMSLTLKRGATHSVHAVLVDSADRAVSDYVNNFYIDEYGLDNQFEDFICSWYVEFVSESGYANNFGS